MSDSIPIRSVRRESLAGDASRLPYHDSLVLRGGGVRGLASYLFAGAILFALTEWMGHAGASVALGETGAVESVQVTLLGFSVVGLWRADADGRGSPLSKLLAAFLLTMLIRELDGFFDLLVHGFWKVPAYAVAAVATAFAVSHRAEVRGEWGQFVNSRAAGMLATALFVLLVQSRVLGQQRIWEEALGADYTRAAPRIVEELSELGGYLLLALAAAERWRAARREDSAT